MQRFSRLIVRIAAVGIDGDDRRGGRRQTIAFVSLNYELLQRVLGQANTSAGALSYFVEGLEHNFLESLTGFDVRLQLGGRPPGLEKLHQICRRDDIDADRPNQLDNS